MKYSSFHCFLNCCFSWRGRCAAPSEAAWLRECTRSLYWLRRGEKELAAVPEECPILHEKVTPPWKKSEGGER